MTFKHNGKIQKKLINLKLIKQLTCYKLIDKTFLIRKKVIILVTSK